MGHTPERIDELKAEIDDILSEGRLGRKRSERLRGRMVFFEALAGLLVLQ